jgi:prophage regulatory protein
MPIKLFRLAAVISIVGLSKATIYKKIKEGSFPAPVKLSAKASGWRSTDLENWINQLQAGGDKA